MEQEPSIVFNAADLLRVFIYDSEIKDWAEQTLIKNTFVKELNDILIELANNFEKAEEAQVKRFASQIHLICLLWDRFGDVYINSLCECDFYNNVIVVVEKIITIEKHSSRYFGYCHSDISFLLACFLHCCCGLNSTKESTVLSNAGSSSVSQWRATQFNGSIGQVKINTMERVELFVVNFLSCTERKSQMPSRQESQTAESRLETKSTSSISSL